MRDEIRLERGSRVLCACSGGSDSTAMLHALASLRRELGIDLVAHGVDHGLRAEAAAELQIAREVADQAGVPFGATLVDVQRGGNLQARARSARYDALRDAADRAGAALIATAHTADDRAETVLLRLLRGSGPRGLAVLPPREGDRIRPIVRASREDVARHLQRNKLSFANDPSNLDTRYARVRVRLELLPLMRTLSPRIVETLAALADELASVKDAPDPLRTLGRRQRAQIEQALSHGKTARVRVDDCKEVLVRLSPTGPVLTEIVAPRAARTRS
ncbi:MAG: tRNA lysidine(34) synthetase TilS [Polyangiaceae bacterium]|nr:tRNA lysidine(34) synthetase TilS [Polyangiaceae bacterium]